MITLHNYRKNGELFLNRLSIRPLVDREGQVIHCLGVQYDLTGQVKAQPDLERLQFELEQRAHG